MTRTLILSFAMAGIIVAACSEDSDTTAASATAAGPGSTNAATTSTTGPGPGGSGSGGNSQGGQGGNGVGGCASCNDWLMDPMGIAVTDICGVESYDPMAGDLTCTAGTSCELVGPLLECACVDCPDADECGPDFCAGMTASEACTTCLARVCDPQNACANDG